MIAFCAWLIEQGLFESIQLSFLPVGHTHINADVPFGIIKNWLKKHSIKTIEDFLAALQSDKILKLNETINSWVHSKMEKVC